MYHANFLFFFIASISQPYLSFFQADAPILPFIFDELESMLLKPFGLIFQKSVISNAGKISTMLNR